MSLEIPISSPQKESNKTFIAALKLIYVQLTPPTLACIQ